MGPESGKVRNALCGLHVFQDFQVPGSLAFIILKGYLTRNLRIDFRLSGWPFSIIVKACVQTRCAAITTGA